MMFQCRTYQRSFHDQLCNIDSQFTFECSPKLVDTKFCLAVFFQTFTKALLCDQFCLLILLLLFGVVVQIKVQILFLLIAISRIWISNIAMCYFGIGSHNGTVLSTNFLGDFYNSY